MKRRQPSRFSFDWSVAIGDHERNVDLTVVVKPAVPPRINCSNEDAYPGDPAEVEITSVLISPPLPSEGPWQEIGGDEFLALLTDREVDSIYVHAQEEVEFYDSYDGF